MAPRSGALLLLACAAADALRVAAPMGAMRVASGSTAVRVQPATMQFGKKKTAVEILEEKGYWPGEWVCADCGYIYEPGTSPAFEELRARWKCPQCAGPRRRFVKKAGGVVGGVDDSPLIIGTAVTAILIAALVYIGLTI